MSRRYDFGRAAIRAAREREAAERRALRMWEQNLRARERASKNAQKEARARHIAEREFEVETLNEQIAARCAEIDGLIEHTLRVDDSLSFETLRRSTDFPAFVPSTEIRDPQTEPIEQRFVGAVKQPSVLLRWIPWVRNGHARKVVAAKLAFVQGHRRWEELEVVRVSSLQRAAAEHEAQRRQHVEQVEVHNREVDVVEAAYANGHRDAILAVTSLVLERSEYPDGFDPDFALELIDDVRELIVEYRLPQQSVVPENVEHRYVKSRDGIDAKPRKPADVRSLYRAAISAVCIRSIHEVFESDVHGHLRTVVFNGYIPAVDPSTGLDSRRWFVAVRAKRDAFLKLDLRRVDHDACLAGMGARLAAKPDELQSVEPITPYGRGEEGVVEEIAPSPGHGRRARRA